MLEPIAPNACTHRPCAAAHPTGGRRRRAPAGWLVCALLAALGARCASAPPADAGDAVNPDAVANASDGSSFAMDAPDAPSGPPTALWQLPRTGPGAFTLPWPNDLALSAGGTVDFAFVPNPVNSALLRTYVTALAGRVHGFSTVGAIYLRFTTPIDTSTLPAGPAESLTPSASVMLVDIDPASAERGQRRPAEFYFRETSSHYWPPDTLAVSPAAGFPLRPHTRYAVVVTDRLRAASGGAFARDADLAAVLAPAGGDDAVAAARARYAPALAELATAGVPAEGVLSLAVFTTQDPVTDFFHAVRVLHTSGPPPAVIDIAHSDQTAQYAVYTGHFGPDAIFQSGTPPYSDPGSGDFVLGTDGNPVIQGTQDITFALTVPAGAMPAGGWPIVVYAHGTGGNARSFISDGTAAALASQGLAVFGFDQVFNGDRAVGGAMLAEEQFFNFANPLAVRTNNRQAGLDLVQVGRLIPRLTVPASVSATSTAVAFDATKIMFFGHSQGGLNGPLWLAAEDTARAGVLSGAAGTLPLAITEKTQPVNIPMILAALLALPSSGPTELVPSHPVITMLQTAIDTADPVNYARYIVREPLAGNAPHHVFQTEGFVDHYAPDDAIASLAIAIGDELAAPMLHTAGNYALTGLPIAALPLRLNAAAGRATAVWQQFDAPAGDDGHFVVFDVAEARSRAARFLGSYVTDPMNAPSASP